MSVMSVYIYIQLDVHRRSQDSALRAVKERNRPVGVLLKSNIYIYIYIYVAYKNGPCKKASYLCKKAAFLQIEWL